MCIVFVSYIGTGILKCLAIKVEGIISVTTAKCLKNLVCTIYRKIGSRNRSGITSSIHLVYTGQSATVNDNSSFLIVILCVLRCIWLVCCQVTSTVNSFHIISCDIFSNNRSHLGSDICNGSY